MKLSVKVSVYYVIVGALICAISFAVYSTITYRYIENYISESHLNDSDFDDLHLLTDDLVRFGIEVLICAFSTLIVLLLIYLNISIAPIKQAVEYAKVLSEGDCSKLPTVTSGDGEIGQLMRSLVHVRDRVQGTLQKLDRSYQKQEESLKEVEAARMMKRDFLANISRGLRDPLNSILGFSEIILKEVEKGKYDYDLRERVNIIYNSADHLNSLISNLIELSKLDADQILLNEKVICLSDFMDDLVQYNIFEAEQKGISIGIHFTSDLPQFLITDQEILFHTLTNLISNGIKSSSFGGNVSFGAELEHSVLTFWVKDYVLETDSVPLSKIYTKFVESETELFQGIKGSSILSMTIAKAHAELLGAWIETELTSDGSSIFRVCFEAKDVIASKGDIEKSETCCYDAANDMEGNKFAAKAGSAFGDINQSEVINVLMAENNESNRMLVETILNEANCELEYVDDGVACLEVLNRKQFDILLLDLHIKKIEAIKIIDKIRENSPLEELPIIVMAAYIESDERSSIVMAGASDFILKPIDSTELIDLVRTWYKKLRD